MKYISSLVITLLLQSCSAVMLSTEDVVPEWSTPTAAHSLVPAQLGFSPILWERQFYVSGSADKRLKCASVGNIVILVGASNAQSELSTYALDGDTGSILWSLNESGILTSSGSELFVANGTTVSSINPLTGSVKWKRQLLETRNITSIMYYDGYLYVYTTGINAYYVMEVDGDVVYKYADESDFRYHHRDIPFYPNLPFGYAIDNDVTVRQKGDALYTGEVYDNSSQELLWMVERESISNFLIFQESIFWISGDDHIKRADKFNGELLETISIVPSIDFFSFDIERQHAGYYLCGNDASDKVYVILGDSRQIFAVRLQ